MLAADFPAFRMARSTAPISSRVSRFHGTSPSFGKAQVVKRFS